MRGWIFILWAAASVAALSGEKFSLQSKDLTPDGTLAQKHVFSGMGCTGDNVSPELSWSDAPNGTKSFVVTLYDPDAPSGSGWWHWVVYNIPATIKSLTSGVGSGQGELPKGAVQGRTDFGSTGYGGACPPTGDKPHRYIFTVYALNTEKLDVPADASAASIGFATRANSLGSATLTVRYGRAK